ncbi:MAG: thiamine pyrophosphate-binding protein [Symploca sp. SIO2E6]|nr:thiamine pyrophosphate-binding protein [Symploca sp. SIO2E6]
MERASTSAIGLILDYLHHEGVQYIFGVPGGPLTMLYQAIAQQDRIQPILAKHEEGAAFMADGYARVRRGLGVCCCTTGPGSTNALTGIASAYADSIPVLLLTAQISTAALGKGASQESSPFGIDTIGLFKHVTKLSAAIPHEQKVAELTQRAIRIAMTRRYGPVHLSIAGDVAQRPSSAPLLSPKQYRPEHRSVDLDALTKAAQLLTDHKQICFLVGHGVYLSDASEALQQLAEEHNIPVATTPKAKGSFPENHPLSLGVFGYSGHPKAEKYIFSEELDVLVVIGSSLGEVQTNAWDSRLMPSKALVQIDIDPEMIGLNYPITVGVVEARSAASPTAPLKQW